MRRKQSVIKKLLRILSYGIAGYCMLVLLLSLIYLAVPPVSTLMLARWATWQKVTYAPVPLSGISPHLIRMVLLAEDSRFCTHYGVNWGSMEKTIEDAAARKRTRGASTIPMQVTKNIFLWPQHSYIRKTIEIPLAMALNAFWPKRRMLEVYLSIAEWGDGIYGAEAASQTYFHKSAGKLSQYEAALLTAALPSPKRRNPTNPSAYQAQYTNNLLRRTDEDIDLSCLR